MVEESKQSNNQEKDKSGIERLPEKTRRLILWLTIMVLMLVIFSFWLTLLPKALTPSQKDKERDQSFSQIQDDLSDFLVNTQEQITELKQNFETLELETATITPDLLPEATTTIPKLSETEIDKIKEILTNNN